MGTHGVIILHIRGRRIVFWNQFDSYASGLGNILIKDLIKVWNDIFLGNTEQLIHYIETFVTWQTEDEQKETPRELDRYTFPLNSLWSLKCNYDPHIRHSFFALSKVLAIKRAYVMEIIEPDVTSSQRYMVQWEYHIDLDKEEFRVPQINHVTPFSELKTLSEFTCDDDHYGDD